MAVMPSVIDAKCRNSGLLCWVSLCWMSLCWVSLCWMSWRRFNWTLMEIFKFIFSYLLARCLFNETKHFEKGKQFYLWAYLMKPFAAVIYYIP